MANTVAVDLFAGAGGLSLGSELAGVPVRVLVDADSYSAETLRRNPEQHAGVVIEADVRTLDGATIRKAAGLGRDDTLVVVGGAPCQPFSKAAYWVDPGEEAAYRRARSRGEGAERPTRDLAARPDARRSLVQEYWRLVVESGADGFVFENVPSILHPRNRAVMEDLQKAAHSAGFATTLTVATATDYGVAQARQRVFLLGSRSGEPELPAPTHGPEATKTTKKYVTSGEALAPFRSSRFREPAETISGRWAKHLEEIPPGMNYKWHTSWAGHPDPTFEAETRYWNFLLKLSPDRPSWTIPASPGPWTGPFHWESRRLRVPELAALQGFPRGYTFFGPRREQVRQVGNAVPPLMASHMVRSVATTLSSVAVRESA